MQQEWVALKIVLADETPTVEARTLLGHRVATLCGSDATFVTYSRYSHIDGPNGRHLCLVLPVLGPSAHRLSYCMESRIEPWLVRRVGYQTARALADLHAQDLCHGGKQQLSPINQLLLARSKILQTQHPPILYSD
jgi:serine/threonine-protein kinase SRPK3